MYTLFHHEDYVDCSNKATLTKNLDWLNRIKVSSEIPPMGELVKGEIMMVSDKGKAYTSGYATRKICLNVPVYFIVGILL